jgi:hypothetical protein
LALPHRLFLPLRKNFLGKADAHLCFLGPKSRSGNGSFKGMASVNPPFMALPEAGPAARSNVDAMQSADV